MTAPPAPPTIISTLVTPSSLPATGGEAGVIVNLKGATTCKFTLVSSPVPVIYSAAARPCDTQFSADINLGPNPAMTESVVRMTVTATNAAGSSVTDVGFGLSPPGLNVYSGPQLEDTSFAGYTVTNDFSQTGSYVGVSGQFTIPGLTLGGVCGEATYAEVAVDAIAGGALLQYGTTGPPGKAICSTTVDTAELYLGLPPDVGGASRTAPATPGDTVVVTITEANGTWTETVTDLTTGTVLTGTATAGPSTSASWGAEAAGSSSLAPFAPVFLASSPNLSAPATDNAPLVFSQLEMPLTGTAQTLAAYALTPTPEGSARPIVVPGSLAGDSFGVSGNI